MNVNFLKFRVFSIMTVNALHWREVHRITYTLSRIILTFYARVTALGNR